MERPRRKGRDRGDGRAERRRGKSSSKGSGHRHHSRPSSGRSSGSRRSPRFSTAGEESLYDLIDAALEARGRSARSSAGVRYGAALLARSGKTYTGCAVSGSTQGGIVMSAEQTAITKAVSEGDTAFEVRWQAAGAADPRVDSPPAFSPVLFAEAGSLQRHAGRVPGAHGRLSSGRRLTTHPPRHAAPAD